MSWERTHRRYRLVYAVAGAVAVRGPRALASWTSRIEAEYGTVETFRLDVLRRWNMAVDARLETSSTLTQVEADVARSNRQLQILLTALENTAALEALPQPA